MLRCVEPLTSVDWSETRRRVLQSALCDQERSCRETYAKTSKSRKKSSAIVMRFTDGGGIAGCLAVDLRNLGRASARNRLALEQDMSRLLRIDLGLARVDDDNCRDCPKTRSRLLNHSRSTFETSIQGLDVVRNLTGLMTPPGLSPLSTHCCRAMEGAPRIRSILPNDDRDKQINQTHRVFMHQLVFACRNIDEEIVSHLAT